MQHQRTLTTHQSTGAWTRGPCGALVPFGSLRQKSVTIHNSISQPDGAADVPHRQQLHGACSSSTGQQQQQQELTTPSSCSMQPRKRSSGHSSNWMVLPAVAMHQLSMSLHMPAHATESVSPAALVLFREFLVGPLHCFWALRMLGTSIIGYVID
jgi:hypothetical protein